MTGCKENYPDIFKKLVPVDPGNPELDRAVNDPIRAQNVLHKRLYLAVRHLLRLHFSFDADGSSTPEPRDFPNGFGKKGKSPGAKVWEDLLAQEKLLFLGVYGTLVSRNQVDPALGRLERGVPGPEDIVLKEADVDVLIVAPFVQHVTAAVKDFNASKALFSAVYSVLLREGATGFDATGIPVETTVYARQVAEVTQRLVAERRDPASPHIRRFVIDALSQAIGSTADGQSSSIDINLPDLEAGAAVDIVGDNVRAVAALYFSAMLEEMKLFAVTEKVVEHFQTGMLPVSRGPAGERIYEWMRSARDRFTESERRSLYGRVLGQAQGAASDVAPNREFADLWVRFLSSLSFHIREARSLMTQRLNPEVVHKAARDLAVNVSLHGYGVSHFAAVEMQGMIREMIALLSSAEVLSAYGVNDQWQLVDRISSMYLGGSSNGVRFRTMAKSGSDILLFLAQHAPELASPAAGTLFYVSPTTLGGELNMSPELYKLVNHVDRWLAVTGMSDAVSQKYTDPQDLAQQPTLPSLLSSGSTAGGNNAVRSVLDRAGIALPTLPQA